MRLKHTIFIMISHDNVCSVMVPYVMRGNFMTGEKCEKNERLR